MPWKPMYSSDVRLSTKTVVITGANTGIGKETVRELYARGARIIMGVRTLAKGEAARQEIVVGKDPPAIETAVEDQGTQAMGDGQTTTGEGQKTTGEGQKTAGEGQTKTRENHAAAVEGSTKVKEDQATAEEGHVTAGKGQETSEDQAVPESGQTAAGSSQAGGEGARETTAGSIEVKHLDLESLASVRAFAEEVNAATDKIDILILNAGKMACPRSETKDGFESQLGTNHLGHFLLTGLLLEGVKAAAPSRVVVLSSVGHRAGAMHWDDLQLTRRYGSWKAYFQSKLANVLFASELSRRLEGSGVSTYAVHPGWVRTELERHLSAWTRLVTAPFRFVSKSPVQGAQTTLYCALAPELASVTGRYYADCRETQPSARAQSVEDAGRLWQLSETLVGLSP